MVSIIIPVYNVEKYVGMCIESILMQTYENYEVILVDDGSKDDSLSVCKKYAEIDKRIKVINQENKGPSGARNIGISAASGEYIYFIDSDDCINPMLLETVVKLAEKTRAAMVQINLSFVKDDFYMENIEIEAVEIKDNQVIIGEKEYKFKSFDTIQAFYNLDKDDKSIAENIRLTTSVVWTKLYRRSVFKDLSFPEEVRIHEDQMMAHRLICQAGGMVFADIPLYYYRQAANESLIRVGWIKKRLAILDCYDDRLKYAVKVYDNAEEALKSRAAGLRDYIYLRTLVCYFRNIDMAHKNLSGEGKREILRNILQRMEKILKSRAGRLTLTKMLFFKAFIVCPGFFTAIFDLRNLLKNK